MKSKRGRVREREGGKMRGKEGGRGKGGDSNSERGRHAVMMPGIKLCNVFGSRAIGWKQTLRLVHREEAEIDAGN